MTLGNSEIARLLAGLVVLLIGAHGLGYLFARIRQPPVVGEIVAGILLGPTLFGELFPGQQQRLFPDEGPTAAALGALHQIGLLLLMFVAGTEIRSLFHRGERKTAGLVTASGMVMPFAAGVLFLLWIDESRFYGDAKESTAFAIVFAIAIAIASIPVISRIMLDLGIIDTSLARIVLTAAVIEDVILYVLLAVALGLVHAEHGDAVGLPSLLDLDGGSALAVAYHVCATLVFFGAFLVAGPRLLHLASRLRSGPTKLMSPIAFQLTFVFGVTAIALLLGISAFLGAFVAGIVSSQALDSAGHARTAVKSFSFAFFIPVYFALVGLRLDLGQGFDPLFFLYFLVFACVTKGLSVYGGARLGGEGRRRSVDLAAAMNARGGPAIVLASVALDATIIDDEFYSYLVLLAMITSVLAAWWLARSFEGRSAAAAQASSPSHEASRTT